jgi:TonB family protein
MSFLNKTFILHSKCSRVFIIVLVVGVVIAGGVTYRVSRNRSAAKPSTTVALDVAAAIKAKDQVASWQKEKRHASDPNETTNELSANASVEEILALAKKYEASLANGRVDWQKAYDLYQRAADMGSTEAAYRKGRIAEKRLLDHVDPASALSDFEQAAEGGYANAYAALARLYIEGQLVPVDAAKAAYYTEKGVEAGSADAMYLKGARLVETAGGGREGLTWLMEAANTGNVDAQYTIARLFLDGKAVGQDKVKAEAWLRLAAENGSDVAKVELASQLIKETGNDMASEKVSEIVNLLLSASDANNARASHYLSRLLLSSPTMAGVDISAVRSYAEKALEAGHTESAFTMALTYGLNGSGDTDTALSWLEMGAAAVDWRSRYARQLIRDGSTVPDALRTAAGAQYQDWAEASSAPGKEAPAGLTPPKAIAMPAPVFPPGLAALDIKGTAVVEFVIGEDGHTHSVQVVKNTHSEFGAAVVAAVSQWQFVPAMRDGKPAAQRMRVPMVFNSQN